MPEPQFIPDSEPQFIPDEEQPKSKGVLSGILESFGLPGQPQSLSDFNPIPGLKQMVTHPIDTGKLILGSMGNAEQGVIDRAYELQHSQGIIKKLLGVQEGIYSLIPGAGPNLSQASQDFEKGDYAHGAGLTAGTAAQLVAPKVGEMIADKLPLPGNPKIQGAQGKFAPADLPPNAIAGAERVFRAAAPVGSNTQFRDSLYTAAGDLAEIGRKLDLSESKGGIVNPDMRPRATVEAIGDHLQQMYQEERLPQIIRNAPARVVSEFGPDATEGLKYLSRAAGSDSSRRLAASAMNADTLPLLHVDQLARIVNKELLGFESMTPAERAAASTTSKRLGALKALDGELGGMIGRELEMRGEPGISAYERRYAALSNVRDQLQTRVNATELKRTNPLQKANQVVSGILGFAKNPNIASASQAAVANVNIGRELQQGLRALADSGIVPERPVGTGRRVAGLLKAPAIEQPYTWNDPSGTPRPTLPPLVHDPAEMSTWDAPGYHGPKNYRQIIEDVSAEREARIQAIKDQIHKAKSAAGRTKKPTGGH